MSRPVPWVLTAAVVALLTQPVRAQVAQHERVAEALGVVEVWLDAQRDYEQIPSISAAIVHDQELIWSGSVGMAHPDRGIEATPTTLYSICSISKLFTSVSVMQLRDRGLFTLRDHVGDILPWFELEQQYEGSPPITVEGILTHSAGLPRESNQPYWSAPDFPFPTHDEIVAGLEDQKTLYPARQYFQYSNLGLTLAGEIVAQVSGMGYHDYVRRNVLDPLGLTNTYSEMPEQHVGGQLATGYSAMTREGKREQVPFFQARGIAPAAGYASTVEDLAKFASWQFRLTGNREEVLYAHTLDEMHRVHYVDPAWGTFWGLGFSVSRRNDETFIGHGGSCPGFRSQLVLHPESKIATVAMANAMINAGTYAYGVYDLVAEAITEATADDDGKTAKASPQGGQDSQEAVETPDLDNFVGAYSQQPWGGETAVVRWKGGLAMLNLPTDNPLRALTRIRHQEGDVFRRVRPDDELGEAIVFERGADGRVTGYRRHGNLSPRIR
jgi:CubicO group peptidase (beta-lactamase class C family)